ncbi:hypothetical protein [Pseudomonas sp. KNUC1026]|uniref:hypothetical protein n=1 Tax=Pseudomonas sp. KNUC1026 TaxID=2893890 RepID=UPI001F1929B8|nr:hypothetical protein [Pseudomonas sp. KNUC1026]UFH50038.1 hypothetical protein LN139_01300 [Pseudomonas sp. KNUC1026]
MVDQHARWGLAVVGVGFIVEGDSEKIVVEAGAFRDLLAVNGLELISPVLNAKGGGNLLPRNIGAFLGRLEAAKA